MTSDRSNGKGISNNQNDDVGGGDYEDDDNDENDDDDDDDDDIFNSLQGNVVPVVDFNFQVNS